MRNEITIDDFSRHLFWDVDLSVFDIHNHREQLTFKVVEYGKLSDWRNLLWLYGKEDVKNIVLNLRNMDVVTLSFLSLYFNIDKEHFRCYKHKQSVENYWNS